MVLFSVVINSFVHVIMYSYYFAALFGPEVQHKLEKIKRNITLIQMVCGLCGFRPIQSNEYVDTCFFPLFFVSAFFPDPVYHNPNSMRMLFGTWM